MRSLPLRTPRYQAGDRLRARDLRVLIEAELRRWRQHLSLLHPESRPRSFVGHGRVPAGTTEGFEIIGSKVSVKIDTSAAGFLSTPTYYVTAEATDVDHLSKPEVADPKPASFTIRLKVTSKPTATPVALNWLGVEQFSPSETDPQNSNPTLAPQSAWNQIMNQMKSIESAATNLTPGRILLAKDLNDIFGELTKLRQLHNRLLHGCGAIEGLTITPAGKRTVAVSPGFALSRLGRELHLREETTRELPPFSKSNLSVDGRRQMCVILHPKMAEWSKEANAGSVGRFDPLRFNDQAEVEILAEEDLFEQKDDGHDEGRHDFVILGTVLIVGNEIVQVSTLRRRDLVSQKMPHIVAGKVTVDIKNSGGEKPFDQQIDTSAANFVETPSYFYNAIGFDGTSYIIYEKSSELTTAKPPSRNSFGIRFMTTKPQEVIVSWLGIES
jgi:hypothetical protein